MRVAIVGAGALGSLYAALLEIAQEPPLQENASPTEPLEVWLIGGGSATAHTSVIAQQGLSLELSARSAANLPPALAQRLQLPVKICTTTNPADAFPCDLALVLVKSYRTADAAHQTAQLLADDGLAVSLQNGLGNREVLAEILGQDRAVQGVTLLGGNLLTPGAVKMGMGRLTTIGTPNGLSEHQLYSLALFKSWMERLGFTVNLTEQVEQVLWGKLVVNCGVNALLGLLDVNNGEILEHEESLKLSRNLVHEVWEVAAAGKITLPYATEEEAMEAPLNACRANYDTFNSMVNDLRAGRTTEIEALNGAIVKLANQIGLPAPYNNAVAELIRLKQRLGAAQLAN